VHAEGATAAAFTHQPGKLYAFVDSQLIMSQAASGERQTLRIPIADTNEHVIAINWSSDYGPVAVAVFKIQRGAAAQKNNGSNR